MAGIMLCMGAMFLMGALQILQLVDAQTHSQSRSHLSPFILYENCAVDIVQSQCCTNVVNIGYNFTFGCKNFTYLQATTTPIGIQFWNGTDHCTHPRDNSIVPLSVFGYRAPFFPQLTNDGGIGSYLEDFQGGTVRVIEWSGIVSVAIEHSDRVAHFGTIQLWLFRNGTIGVIFHLTGFTFSGFNWMCYNYNNCSDGGVIGNSKNSLMLHNHSAYLYVPTTHGICTSPSADFKLIPWFGPPEDCYNPLRATDDDYSNPHRVRPDTDYSDPRGTSLLPLCPADLIRSESESESPSPSQSFSESASRTLSLSESSTQSPSFSESSSESPSLSESSSESALFAYYVACDDSKRQENCCSGTYNIGYTFYFGASAHTTFTADSYTRVNFGAVSCGNNNQFFQMFNVNQGRLANSGGIGLHRYMYQGHLVRVIEWSGIVAKDGALQDNGDYTDYVRLGTMQMWLLPNSTIGLIYHLTGQFYDLDIIYNSGDVNIYNMSDLLLHRSEALKATPVEAYTYNAEYDVDVWDDPPDICFNPRRMFDADSSEDSIDNFIDTDFSADNPDGPGPGVDYMPLQICPTDRARRADQTQTQSPLHSKSPLPLAPAVSKQTGAIVGGIVGAAVIVGLALMVFLAL